MYMYMHAHGYLLALCLCLGSNDPGWSLTHYHLQPDTHTSDGLPGLHKEKGMDNIHQHLPKLWALHVGDKKNYIQCTLKLTEKTVQFIENIM